MIAIIATLLFSCRGSGKINIDVDGDGYFNDVDCDDYDPNVYPQASEVCDGIDNDCNGLIDTMDENLIAEEYYVDADQDGHGSELRTLACEITSDVALTSGDCDDSNPAIHPFALETCNETDDNCNDQIDEQAVDAVEYYFDNDNDGYGSSITMVKSCSPPPQYVDNNKDCQDNDANIHPAAVEICDGIDNDCDQQIDLQDPDNDIATTQTYYLDNDNDGYGNPATATQLCEPTSGYVDNPDDCDDSSILINPGIITDSCNATDDDCDGHIDEDVKSGWQLVSIDTNADMVYTIDTSSAATTPLINITGDFKINSMDVSEGVISIVHDHQNKKLWTLNVCTSEISPLPMSNPSINTCGIAFGKNEQLFGVDSVGDNLVSYDLQTGAATIIGPLGISLGTCGLTYDCSEDRLIGANGNTGEIFTIDPLTGQAYDIIQTTVPFQSVGVEFDHQTGLLLASTKTELYSVDPTNGDTTLIGPLGGSNIDDLAYYPQCTW